MKTTRSMLMVVMTMAVMIGSASAALITGTTIQSATTGLNADMGPEKAINGVGLPGDTPALSGSHIQSHSTNWWTGWSGAVTDWQITVDLEGNFALDTIHVWNYREGGTLNNRGLRNVEIYVSPDEDENNLVKLNTNGSGTQDNGSGDFLFPVAPGTSEYLGFDLDTSGVTNASLLDNARLVRLDGGPDNHDGGSTWGGLAEIQFGGGDPVTGGGPSPVDIPVPNGSFEDLYKPGTTIAGKVAIGGWTQGVGPDCPIDSGQYEFDDSTTGTAADIAGWIGADRDGWIAEGGTYGRDQTTGNLQGSIGRQSDAPDGVQYYLSNGGGWGNPAGGLIVSDAPLAAVENGTYTLSMWANGAANPIVLDLLADGVVVTPTSSVDPTLSGEWQEFSRTYDPASLAGLIGQDLTIQLGLGREAEGSQSHFDSVSLSFTASAVPEPSTFVLAALGLLGLGLVARRRKQR